MANEKLHEAALEILQKKGVTLEMASVEEYRQVAEQAQSEGVEYEQPATQQMLHDLDRQFEVERGQLLVEWELSQLGVTMETASAEQLHEAVDKADATLKAAKQT